MSFQFTAAELANLRTAQAGHMLDTGIRQVHSRTFDTFGGPVDVWTDASSSTACGLDMRPGVERHKPDMTIVQYDASLRLPIATTIDPKDRWKITHRFGEAITNLVFEIAGPIQRGPSGIRLLLRKVEV
jgi:hypothetical protein